LRTPRAEVLTLLTNDERIQRGLFIVQSAQDAGDNDDATNLVDALADLMHWAKSADVSFADAVRMAEIHFNQESA
jgi:hypothetical protein